MHLMSIERIEEAECYGTHMLVNEQDCHILAFCELLEGCLNGRYLGF